MNKKLQKLISVLVVLLFGVSLFSSQITLDSQGILSVDGVRTFVYGISRNPSGFSADFDETTECGFGFTHEPYFENQLLSGYIQAEIDELIYQSSFFIDNAGNSGLGVYQGIPSVFVSELDLASITYYINSLKGKPGLWFWLLTDLSNSSASQANIEAAYNAVKAADGNHPVMIIGSADDFYSNTDLVDFCDIMAIKRHSVPYSQIALGRDIGRIKADFANKCVLAFCQGIDMLNLLYNHSGSSGIELERSNATLTLNSLKSQVYASAFSGAAGVIFDLGTKLQNDIMEKSPFILDDFEVLGEDISRFSDIWLNGQELQGVEIEYVPYGLEKRVKSYWGLSESETLEAGLPDVEHVSYYSRELDGQLYIMAAADYMCCSRLQCSIPFVFSSIIEYPGEKVVASFNNGQVVLEQEDTTVGIWNVEVNQALESSYFDILVNEKDCFVWKINR
ncbi:MAG: hypothetical protein ACIAQZ_13455 [Sedimentisphaeraceae bacterium JB056]